MPVRPVLAYVLPEALWTSWLTLHTVNRDKWGPWLWGPLCWPGFGAPWETEPVRCPQCRQHHGPAVQECLLTCSSESRFWDIWTDAWETWKPKAIKWWQTASTDEPCMCTRLQFLHSLRQSFLPVQAHWRVVVATGHFHAFQCLWAWVFDKLQHTPPFVSNRRPTHIVPPVAEVPPHVAKPTACDIRNNVKGVLSIPPRAEPQFTDTAPTVEELQWQLTQAATAAERTWVVEALARHRHVAPPRKRPTKPLPPPAPTPASAPHESRKSMPDLSCNSQGELCYTPKHMPPDASTPPDMPPPGKPSYWRTTTSTCAGKRTSFTRNKRRGGT